MSRKCRKGKSLWSPPPWPPMGHPDLPATLMTSTPVFRLGPSHFVPPFLNEGLLRADFIELRASTGPERATSGLVRACGVPSGGPTEQRLGARWPRLCSGKSKCSPWHPQPGSPHPVVSPLHPARDTGHPCRLSHLNHPAGPGPVLC